MLTVIIPTLNRPDFVARLLEYYAAQKFRHTIFIGDSSDGTRAEILQGAIEKFGGRLNVRWFDAKGINNYEVMQQLLEKVQTPYAAYLADDDFLVAPTMDEAIAFMETHPDYAGAGGKALIFQLKQDGAYGVFEMTGRYAQFAVEAPDPVTRLLDHTHSRYTSVFHSVCRTAWLKQAVRRSGDLNRGAKISDATWWTVEYFGELATSSSLVIQGKIKVLDSLYYIRQIHSRRYIFPDWFDWMTSPNWHTCWQVLRGQLSEDLVQQGISEGSAEENLKKAFWRYFVMAAVLGLKGEVDEKERRIWKNLAKKIPGAKEAWRALRFRRDETSLRTLLQKGSPHHDRFWPIYSLITSGVEKNS